MATRSTPGVKLVRTRSELYSGVGPHSEVEASLFSNGCRLVAGVDEVGRGAWAGPVSVGVAAFDVEGVHALPEDLRDSKALRPLQRERLFPQLATACVAFAVGHASAEECDVLGMTAAQAVATRRAIAALGHEPDALVVDGSYDFTGHHRTVNVVGGDRSSVAVAAASVLAKVTRDAILVESALSYPGYALERNKGYASLEHRRAVHRLGMTAIHRKSWTFVRPFVEE